jgi:hypothetical protein
MKDQFVLLGKVRTSVSFVHWWLTIKIPDPNPNPNLNPKPKPNPK